jgi:ribonuclease R
MAKRRQRRSSDSSQLQGTYVGHTRGFGFLVLEGGGSDLFVPPKQEGAAIDGDTVLAEPGPRGTAKVKRVLTRGRSLLAGTYLGRGAFAPDAHRVPKILSVDGKARKGDKVLITATTDAFRIRRILGRAGAREAEDGAVLAELEILPRFPRRVLADAERLAAPRARDFKRRLDLRDKTTVVTIDPVTSRDFDDAISLERRGKEWLLGVHIADVSHYVGPDSAIDREAHKRGTSVYLLDLVIPMLPEALSNDLCSLREGVDRLAMSVLLRYDAKAKLQETTFAESVIRSDRRFSYERASRVMDRSAREKGPVGDLLLDMARLAALLKRGRPSHDLPRQEIDLVFDGQGDVVDLRPTVQDEAHGVIEEFMLAANREVARLLRRRGVATIYRHHPEPADLSGVWETLRRLGVASEKSTHLGRALATAAAKGYGPTVTAAMLRCMPSAVYTTASSSHFSLGFDTYTHFTSPIRRYSDLVVHRQLRGVLRDHGGELKTRASGALPALTADDSLEGLAAHVTARSAAAGRAESRIRRRRVLEFLLRMGGVPTEGQVTMVVERGLVVDLPEFGTSGFLATEVLPDGPFELESDGLRGRRRIFTLGETLEVCVHRIDPASSQLDLALAPDF